ncbi:MAG: phosphotransferase [Pseudomonadota bacterium]
MDNAPILTPIKDAHRFDEKRLAEYLADNLAEFKGPLAITQFEGGQSNPTFLLEAAGRKWVLRRKPPGQLLPSAHQVDREYRVMKALEGTRVPVPKMLLLCRDETVMGSMFFVMEHIPGRVLRDSKLPGFSPEERRAVYRDMNQNLAELHNLDYKKLGLEDFGKPGNYYARQISRWSRQYLAARTDDIPEMDALMEHLPRAIPASDEAGVIHGDFRMENHLFHPTAAKSVAVLDWELSTLGHPLGDLAYHCMPYHAEMKDASGTLSDIAGPQTGLPTEKEYLAWYCERTGRAGIEHWNFYLAFALFRMAGILQGVYKRGLLGNASSAAALERGKHARLAAVTGWKLLQEME